MIMAGHEILKFVCYPILRQASERGRPMINWIAERLLPPTDKWAVVPLVFDLDADGDDEIVTWGRKLIVIGRRS